jgi:hypothetical protein
VTEDILAESHKDYFEEMKGPPDKERIITYLYCGGMKEDTELIKRTVMSLSFPLIIEFDIRSEITEKLDDNYRHDKNPFEGMQKKKEESKDPLDMSELMYFVKIKKKNLSLKVSSAVEMHGKYGIIHGFRDYRDMFGLDPENIDHLLAVLNETRGFENFFFLASSLDAASLRLISCSGHLIFGSDPEYTDRIRRIKKML